MALQYLLDTNICIYIRRERPPTVRERFSAQQGGTLGISVITWGELLYAAAKSRDTAIARAKLDRFASQIQVLSIPEIAAEHYGDIRAKLSASGNFIGANDMWIAAHARAASLTVVTNSEREFRRVPGLKVESWA